jgi:hypothetical protein
VTGVCGDGSWCAPWCQIQTTKGENFMETLAHKLAIVFIFLFGVFFIASQSLAQTGILNVKIEGTIFDRNEPPAPPIKITTTGKVAVSSSSDIGFNVALFSDDPQSPLFTRFEYPGVATPDGNTEIPANAFLFFGTVQDKKIASDGAIYSGKINATSPAGPKNILYQGSVDNPIIFTTDPMGVRDLSSVALFSWKFISGAADNLACEEAVGPLPEPGFIALIERGVCLFFEKLHNAYKAGAIAAIIFNHAAGGDTFPFPSIFTPTAEIPGVFIKRSDGLSLLNYADANKAVPGKVEIDPINLSLTADGTFTTDKKGELKTISLNLHISDFFNHIFVGTAHQHEEERKEH